MAEGEAGAGRGRGSGSGDSSGMGGGQSNGGDGRGGAEARGYGGDNGGGGGGGSVTSAVSASKDDGGYSKSANFGYSKVSDGFSNSAASSNTPSTGEQITAANREMGISDAMTAHNLALNGFSYGDRVSALTGSVLDAAAPNIGFTGHGLISSALSMIPGVGLALDAADVGQKAYTNGISSISTKDGAGLIAGGLSLAGLGPAALAVRAGSALNDAMEGNGGSLGSLAGGFAGNLAGSLTGNPYAGQVGGVIGSQLGGKVGQGDGTRSDNSGGKDSSQGGNGDGWSGGSMTAAVTAAAKPKASVAQTQAGYQQPAMKYLNTSEYM